MPRLAAVAAPAALVLALATDAAWSLSTSIPVNPGDRVYGDLDSAQDRDDFSVDVAKGARLSVSVKALGKPAALLPTLSLSLPDGTDVNLAHTLVGEGTGTVSFPGIRTPETGAHVVGISGFNGSSGSYLATFTVLVDPPPAQTVVVPAEETVLVEFTAWDGALVSFSAVEKGGPPLVSASLVDPAGSPVPGSAGVRKGSKLSVKKILLDGGSGRYAVALEGDASGPTTVALKVSVKYPKASKRKIHLGPEPRPTGITPITGPDGSGFTVTGAGFPEGARVLFDVDNEAEDAALAPDGTLTGTCPRYAGSDAGVDAEVTVLGPDGQFGIVPQKFKYIGRPDPVQAVPGLSPLEGGVTVSILGSRFRPGLSVLFGGAPATGVIRASAILVTCVAPAHASGEVTVEVVDEFGRSTAIPDPFQYADPPSISSASPDTLPSFGGRTVTVTGGEFVPGDRVFVDGVEAADVAVASRSSLTFTAPAVPSGPADLEVRDALGRSGTLAESLLVTPSFQDASDASVPSFPDGTEVPGESISLGDLTGDGSPDIALATGAARTNAVTGQKDPASRFLFNDGGGAFTDVTEAQFSIFSGQSDLGQADGLAVGDLDGDGLAEVLLSRETPFRSSVQYVSYYYGLPAWYLLSTPPDVFDWPTLPATLLLANYGYGSFYDASGYRMSISYSSPAEGRGERWQAAANAIGDLDGDGDDDLLLAAGGRLDWGYFSSVKWFYKKVYYYYYYYYYYVREKAHITQGTYQIGSTRVLLNDGSGVLYPPVWGPGPLLGSDNSILDDFSADACAAGDLDGDGAADAVILKGSATRKETSPGTFASASALRILFSDGYYGNLSFDSSAVPAAYDDANAGSGDFWQGSTVALGDLDDDGDLDIVVGRDKVGYWTDGSGDTRLLPPIRIFRNDGSRTFSEDTGGFLADDLFRTGGDSTILGARAVAIADVDGDGDTDLLVAGRQSTVADAGGGFGSGGILPAGTKSALRVLLNDGSGGLLDATDDWIAPVSSGSLFQGDALAVRDLDGDGLVDIVLVMDAVPDDGKGALRVLMQK